VAYFDCPRRAYPKNVNFPVAESREAFESTGMQGKIKQIGADWAAFVATLKPYPGGNDLLFLLHSYCNADKRRVLTRVGQVSNSTSFSGAFQNQISFNFGTFGFGLEDGDTLVTVAESDVAPKVELSVAVAFCEVGPDKVRGKPVVATLKQFSDLCTALVNAARPLFP
jgi:hypothetical protein